MLATRLTHQPQSFQAGHWHQGENSGEVWVGAVQLYHSLWFPFLSTFFSESSHKPSLRPSSTGLLSEVLTLLVHVMELCARNPFLLSSPVFMFSL